MYTLILTNGRERDMGNSFDVDQKYKKSDGVVYKDGCIFGCISNDWFYHNDSEYFQTHFERVKPEDATDKIEIKKEHIWPIHLDPYECVPAECREMVKDLVRKCEIEGRHEIHTSLWEDDKSPFIHYFGDWGISLFLLPEEHKSISPFFPVNGRYISNRAAQVAREDEIRASIAHSNYHNDR